MVDTVVNGRNCTTSVESTVQSKLQGSANLSKYLQKSRLHEGGSGIEWIEDAAFSNVSTISFLSLLSGRALPNPSFILKAEQLTEQAVSNTTRPEYCPDESCCVAFEDQLSSAVCLTKTALLKRCSPFRWCLISVSFFTTESVTSFHQARIAKTPPPLKCCQT